MSTASPPRPAGPAATCAIGADLWFRREAEGTYLVGLTEAAARRAGRLAQYRGPAPGQTYRAGEPAVSLESEKWVGHLGLPVDGTVVATNPEVEADPSTINRDPYGAGWLYRMQPRESGSLEARAGDPK
jgi:glycine cleavage system H protein